MPATQTRILDISVPVENGMVTWPGDPGVEITRRLDLTCGDAATVSALALGAHTGTHVDSFSHFKQGGQALSDMDLGVYIGKALVINIENPVAVTVDELEKHASDIKSAERVLFKTKNSNKLWSREKFDEDFCHIAPDAAKWLANAGIKLVGIDYLSVESFKSEGAPTHHALMDAGIYIVEGLYLNGVDAGWYEMICLPLNITGGDGAPARVILKK